MLLHSTFALYPALLALHQALRLGLGDPHHPGKLLGFPRRKDSSFKTPHACIWMKCRAWEMKNKMKKMYEDVEVPYILLWDYEDVAVVYFSESHVPVATFFCFGTWAQHDSAPLLCGCLTLWQVKAANFNLRTNWGNTLVLKQFRPPFTAMIPFLPSMPGSSSSTGASTGLPQLVNSQYHPKNCWILQHIEFFR